MGESSQGAEGNVAADAAAGDGGSPADVQSADIAGANSGAVSRETSNSVEPVDTAYTVYRRPHRRRYQTARDMLLSMGAVGLSVAVILAITWRPKPDPVRVVDAAPAVTDVRLLADWPVVNPSPRLPESWRLTVARRDFTPGSEPILALGWVTPSGHWIGMQQSGTQGRDGIRWRNGFLADDWTSAVPYRDGSWRKFANLRACTSACSVATAPVAYAQRVVAAQSSAKGSATYIVYGDAPTPELDAVMRAVDAQLARVIPKPAVAAASA